MPDARGGEGLLQIAIQLVGMNVSVIPDAGHDRPGLPSAGIVFER